MTAPATGRLEFRTGYAADPAGRAALSDLIADVFDIDVRPLERLGGWDATAVPFSWFDGDRVVANVTVHAKPMLALGRPIEPWSVISVATRPQWRGRGLFRGLMARALAFLDARTDLVLLATASPDLYRPFGFRPLAETRFAGPPPAPAEPSGARPRRLFVDRPDDVALLLRLFHGREPVSAVAGLRDDRALFMLNAWTDRGIVLTWLPAHDVAVATERAGRGTFRLLDIVGRRIPPLAALLADLAPSARVVEVCFPPDRLGWTPAWLVPEDAGWMARGPFLPEGVPFAFSPVTI